MSYTYNEPVENEYEPLPEGDYPFTVEEIEATYNNDKGTFILPVTIRLTDTNRTIRAWLSAGISSKNKPFDMIAPFLKCIRRNPAIGEEPDFSSRNLIDASGVAHICEEPYSGDDPKYKGKSFPAVKFWVYDREQANATVSGGKDAKDTSYKKPAAKAGHSKSIDESDDVPF